VASGGHQAVDPAELRAEDIPVVPPVQQRTPLGRRRVALIVGFLAVCFAGLVFVSANGDDEPTAADAYYACQDFVDRRLKAPATADYPPLSTARVGRMGDRWTVSAYVDSENSFGAKIRDTVWCDMTRTEDGWRLDDVSIGD